MITLGVIQSIDNLNNFCKVRLPTLEGAGNKNMVELSATMMLPPGIGAGYEEGDVVFVSFVDNTLGRPMILGQLYKGPNKGTKVDGIGSANDTSLGCAESMTCKELIVKNEAIIPQNTKIDGQSVTPDYNSVAKLINKIKALETELDVKTKALAELDVKTKSLETELDVMRGLLLTACTAGMLNPGAGFAAMAAALGISAVGDALES